MLKYDHVKKWLTHLQITLSSKVCQIYSRLVTVTIKNSSRMEVQIKFSLLISAPKSPSPDKKGMETQKLRKLNYKYINQGGMRGVGIST